jgi:hypothetical protein
MKWIRWKCSRQAEAAVKEAAVLNRSGGTVEMVE